MFDPNQQMPDFATQTATVDRQQKLAEYLRKAAAAAMTQQTNGQMVGGHYVPTSVWEKLAPLVQRFQADQAVNQADQSQVDLTSAMSKHADQWRNSAFPQAIAAQKGMPPNLVMESPEGQAGTPDIPAQPVTLGQVLKKTLAAGGNPLLANDAAAYEKYGTAEVAREDTQQQQRDIQAQAQMLAREKNAEQAQLRREALTQQATAAEQASLDRNASIEQRGQAAAQHNDLMRQLSADRLAAKGSTEKPLPAHLATAFTNNLQGVSQVDSALGLVEKNKDAFGLAKGMLPQAILTRTDPEGVAARAAVADLGSLRIHDRTGAAMTAREEPRLIPFIPSPTDNAETVKTKLKGFKKVYDEMQSNIADFAENQGYKSPRALMSPPQPTGLSAQEQAELDALRARFPKGK